MSDKKQFINVGTIGHIDHGKTTLTAALCRVAAESSKPVMSDKARAEFEYSLRRREWHIVKATKDDSGMHDGCAETLAIWASYKEAKADLHNHGYESESIKDRWIPTNRDNDYQVIDIIFRESIADISEWQAAKELYAPREVELEAQLVKIRDLLSTLPEDALGAGTSTDCEPWSIRDEVIYGITRLLTTKEPQS